MTSVLVELSLSYAIPSEGRRGGSPSAVNEPCPADPLYRGSPIALVGPSARATPPRRSCNVAVCVRTAQASGRRDPERRGRRLRYDRVVALGLHTCIVDGPAPNSGCLGSRGENLHADAEPASRQRCPHPPLDAGIWWQMTALQSNSRSAASPAGQAGKRNMESRPRGVATAVRSR